MKELHESVLRNSRTLVFILLLISLFPLFGDDADPAVASVNGIPITESQLEAQVQPVLANYEMGGIIANEDLRITLIERILPHMIKMELLYQEAKTQGITIPAEVVEQQIDQYRQVFHNDQAFMTYLETNMLSLEQLRYDFNRELMINQLIEELIFPTISIDDERMMDYYQNNREIFFTPPKYRASHILISREHYSHEDAIQKINTLKQLLAEGADFAALAKEHSSCTSADDGGDLGYFSEDEMSPAFFAPLPNMGIGQISDVVESEFGYHLILLTDFRPGQVIEFEAAKKQIYDHLSKVEASGATEDYIQELMDQSEIEIFLDINMVNG